MKRELIRFSVKNLINAPVRTLGLILLAAFLAFSICGGTIVINSLKRGMNSLEERLGADIIVVPEDSYETLDIEGILLDGNNGYFYMDRSKTDEIKNIEGIENISEQLYLTSLSSGCCSLPVQIVGYDPKTDFTIKPWIGSSSSNEPRTLEVVVGNNLEVDVGQTLTFYDIDVKVAAKLDKTGTNLDSTVYASRSTLETLIQSSIDKKLNTFDVGEADRLVSCILINVEKDREISEVLTDINKDVEGVKAIRTKAMISGISSNLAGMSLIIVSLVGVIWIVAFVIMIIAFIISGNSRKKEYAALRILGTSRKKLASIVMTEGGLVCLIGNLFGIIFSLVVILPFGTMIKNLVGLPYLIPSAGQIVLIVLATFLLSITSGLISTSISAYKISKIDTALILREGN